VCWGCRKFRYLVRNCRNKKKEKKGKPIPQNRFEVIASRVRQCGIREEVKVRKQKTVEEGVQCFRCQRIGYYKWECPNIKEKKKRRSEEAAHTVSLQKVQWRGKPVHPNWEKVQEYCGVENVLEDAQLLKLGWIIEEVVATYIGCRWCGKKGMHRENNRGQGVLRERKLEEAKWYGYPKQRRKEEEAACPTKRKVQKRDARAEGTAREVRRIFKILREV